MATVSMALPQQRSKSMPAATVGGDEDEIAARAFPTPVIIDQSSSSAREAPKITNAVNRSWSDVDPAKLLGTFAAASFVCSVVMHPAFLIVARQQCFHEEHSAAQITRSILRGPSGARGLYRGVGISTAGTVLSEGIYYATLEMSKEFLPIRNKEARDFSAGLAADGISGPLYVPFAVVSQRQMVGLGGVGDGSLRSHGLGQAEHLALSPHGIGWRETTRSIVKTDGWRALFRGTLMSVSMMPVSGCWWVLYERLKWRAYSLLAVDETAQHAAAAADAAPSRWHTMLTSRTDNLLVNASVGGVTGGMLSLLLNPLYVVRTRLQVLSDPPPEPSLQYHATPTEAAEATTQRLLRGQTTTEPPIYHRRPRFRAFAVAGELYQRNGAKGFARGLRMNMVMGVGGSMLFGTVYEGTKLLADVKRSP